MAATEERVGERDRMFGSSAHTLPVGYLVGEAIATTPGRGPGKTPDKPTESPWRSLYFVAPRNSADGNGYRKGDFIPEVEAIRQGVYDPTPGVQTTPEAKRKVCARCKGTGNYSRRKPASHRDGCDCIFCGPCHICGGSGFNEEEQHG